MNLLMSILASGAILLGMVSMVTPIPGGVIFIAGGLTVLICYNSTARICLRWIRTRAGWVNKAVFWLENKVGKRVSVIGAALKQTRPLITDSTSHQLGHKEYLKDAISKERDHSASSKDEP
jgi:hypothetical protein